ncbi:MAG: hypothetical protein IPK52_26210 [Chloroflexi bacterium]|nr:hypothetical protein [Chloroflexota bacterium]
MPARTFLIEPFDIMLHATDDGVQSLQARFSTWLRTLREPARFVCWQMPATLEDKISRLSRLAQDVDDPQRRLLLMEYRRHFEHLNESAEYQRALCGMALWSDQNPRAGGRHGVGLRHAGHGRRVAGAVRWALRNPRDAVLASGAGRTSRRPSPFGRS